MNTWGWKAWKSFENTGKTKTRTGTECHHYSTQHTDCSIYYSPQNTFSIHHLEANGILMISIHIYIKHILLFSFLSNTSPWSVLWSINIPSSCINHKNSRTWWWVIFQNITILHLVWSLVPLRTHANFMQINQCW